jgi:hypothetical protein
MWDRYTKTANLSNIETRSTLISKRVDSKGTTYN